MWLFPAGLYTVTAILQGHLQPAATAFRVLVAQNTSVCCMSMRVSCDHVEVLRNAEGETEGVLSFGWRLQMCRCAWRWVRRM